MATLNTLRTKYGIVLSILIAIVLLAFILGDQLSYRGGNQEIVDETVMTIDGQDVKASEYAKQYAYISELLRNSGISQDQIANMVSSIFVYDSMDMSLSKPLELVMDMEAQRPAGHGVPKSQTRLSH